MNKVHSLLKKMIIGIGFGSFFYLIFSLFVVHDVTTITISSCLIVMLMSALIGTYSILFKIERLNFISALSIHFLLTFLTVAISAYWCHWLANLSELPRFFPQVLIIYIIIWLIVSVFDDRQIHDMNQKLQKRNTGHQKK